MRGSICSTYAAVVLEVTVLAFGTSYLRIPVVNGQQVSCSAASTCYGESCDYWVLADDASCQELEDTGCDCSGCNCNSCPATCFSQTCDAWTLQGVSCEHLEQEFACNCNACECSAPVSSAGATTNDISTTVTRARTTTTGELIFTAAPVTADATGTIPLEVVPTSTLPPCPPGHICDNNGPPPTEAAVTTDASVRCSSKLIADAFCDDENNFEICDWDGGDCCGAKIIKAYCEVCACLDPAVSSYYPPNCPGGNSTVCTHPEYDSDGYCDDGNNNCACNWDGGDCCGSDNSYSQCTECECKDVAYESAFCHKGCGAKAFVNDDFCDDENNNCGCGWDGGDCCGKNKHSTYCEICACLDPDEQLDPDHVNCVEGCDSLTFYADGFCDDENNVCGCDWDGGDCCGGGVNFRYCTECDCKDPDYVCPGSASCSNPEHLNDHFCDDGNNNCACNWDHGDCCGDDNYYVYCTECECRDTAYLGLSTPSP